MGAAVGTAVRYGLLGGVRVTVDGREAPVGGTRARTLLAALLLRNGTPVAADTLAETVWGDAVPADARQALQAIVYRLRRALDAAGAGASAAIASRPAGYVATVPDTQLDIALFEAHLARARATAEPAARAEELRRALALWRGPALADITADRLRPAADRLDELRLTAVEDRADAELSLGAHPALVSELQQAVAAHPLRERLRALLMHALYASGRQAEALAQYETARTLLGEELGVDPGPGLRAAHAAVLRQEYREYGEIPREDRTRAEESEDGKGGGGGEPRTRAARPRPLPVPLTPLHGQEAVLASLAQRLPDTRLLTLTGPGGVGKTRLALAAASAQAAAGTHVALAELGTEPDEAAVAATALTALDVQESWVGEHPEGADPVARLLAALRKRPVLLVLDNCEASLTAVAGLLRRLLPGCPQARVLATSREPLRAAGEVVWPVAPLPVPAPRCTTDEAAASPAVRLFLDRAARADATAPAPDPLLVAEVCRRLDGIPLALELAAARLRGMDLPTLAGRLDDRFRLLALGERGAPERRRTLRALVDWSWDLLDDAERVLLRRLAVFGGQISVADAEEICATPPLRPEEILDLLASLTDRSLLTARPGGRYRMLETIRAYATERLAASDEHDELTFAHARHFLAVAESCDPLLRGPSQLAALSRLDDAADDLRAASDRLAARAFAPGRERAEAAEAVVRLGCALGWYWWLRGQRSQGVRRLRTALDAAGERAGTPARARAHALLALLELACGERESGQLSAAAARKLEVRGGHRTLPALLDVAEPFFLGDLPTAREHMTRVADAARAAGDDWGLACVLFLLGRTATHLPGAPRATEQIDESLALFRRTGDAWGEVQALGARADVAVRLHDDTDAARRALEQAVPAAERLDARGDLAYLLVRLAAVLDQQGESAAARRHGLRALATARRDGAGEVLRYAGCVLGLVALRLGDVAEARERYTQAAAPQGPPLPPPLTVAVLAGCAALAVHDREPDRAAALGEEALAAAVRFGELPAVAAPLAALAGILKDRAGAAGRLRAVARQLNAWRPGTAPPSRAVLEALRACAEAHEAG